MSDNIYVKELSQEELEANREEFIRILKETKRQNIEKLIEGLLRTDFFEAPASTKYHNNRRGGLCEHSLNVYRQLSNTIKTVERFKDMFTYDPDGEEAVKLMNSVAIVALLHDLCKANFYEVGSRNVKNGDKWQSVPCYRYREDRGFGHGEGSAFTILQFGVRLSKEEIWAIRYHMGEFEKDRDTSRAYAEFPLAILLHVADLMATYLDEETYIYF